MSISTKFGHSMSKGSRDTKGGSEAPPPVRFSDAVWNRVNIINAFSTEKKVITKMSHLIMQVYIHVNIIILPASIWSWYESASDKGKCPKCS